MKLIITEKPSVGMSIAKVFGVHGRKDGYIENKEYVISWCVGHLIGLTQADKYEMKYKRWAYEDLPIIPEEFKYEVFSNTKKQYEILKKLLNRPDISEVINACDSGREGELIFRLVYNQAKSRKPIKRLWISSMEDNAIKEGFNNLKEGKDFDNLYNSALARNQADWIVGINGTRLFTVLYNELLSVGRVQTPTLALIVNREEEILKFQKKKYFNIDIELGGFMATSGKINEESDADMFFKQCKGKLAIVKEIINEKKAINPPLPFDLTSLQREANRLFGYTAKQTLDYTQFLYEKKWITYPRTDSRYLTEDMRDSLIELIRKIDKNKLITNPDYKRVLNDRKVNEHHGIIPTIESLDYNIENIPKSERNIYNLVCLKLLESISEKYEEELVRVILMVGENEFMAKGKRTLNLGFKGVKVGFNSIEDKEEKLEENLLPEISEGMELKINDIKIRESFTQPPKYFTEDTLLSAMERAGNEEIDKELEVEKRGLGTPATRAGIIEKLIYMKYIERKNKNLLATDRAMNLITVIPDSLKSSKLTAEWENKLMEISLGKGSHKEFLKEIESIITDLVKSYHHISTNNNEGGSQ